MTSQKSSISTFSFTFLSALKGNFFLPLLNMIAITIVGPVLSFLAIKNFDNYNNISQYSGTSETTANKITDLYKFLIFDQYSQTSFNIILHFSVIAFSVFLGVIMFRFIANKKTVNVFYSLGITRKNIFVSKYLAGILMLSVSIIIPFIICLVINILTFGSSTELYSAVFYYIAGYCAISITAFSLTAAIFSCVGTVIEGLTFSGVILLGPTILLYSIQFFMNKLTLGSPYGHFYNSDSQLNSLANSFSKLNPILFLFNNVKNIGSLSRESVGSEYLWNTPNYASIIIWFSISVALFLLGMYLFQKRKAEICGFLGVNKGLNFLSIFLVGLFAMSISILSCESLIIGISIGASIYILLYCIIDFALIRNLKEWITGLIKLPVHIGLVLLIVFIFANGVFGYSSHIPNLDKIDNVEITPISYTGIIDPVNSNSLGEGDYLYSVSVGSPMNGFNSGKDIKTLTSLHKLFISSGKLELSPQNINIPVKEQVYSTSIRIIYHLKNGRAIKRYYNCAKAETLTAMLAIDETDRYKNLIMQNLSEPVSSTDSNHTIINKNVFQNESSIIAVISGNMDKSTKLSLTAKDRTNLLKALAKDLTAQTVNERYFPENPSIGIIRFSPTNINTDIYYEKPDSSYDGFTGLSSNISANIIITEDMQNTINFCKANNIMSCFVSKSEPYSVQIIPAKLEETNYSYYGSEYSLHFIGGWTKIFYEYGSFVGSYKTTDEDFVNKIAKNSYISYYNSVEGFFVRFELKGNGGSSTKFIPASSMPKVIIDAVARHVAKSEKIPEQ